jgi:hypothetical protein
MSASRGERGGILVFVALFVFFVGIPFMIFVTDVANWFEHKRHLQLQADAAVLAAAGDYRFPCSDAAITNRARQYSGLSTAPPTPYNAQVGGTPTSRVHLVLNSRTFYSQSSPSDTTVNTAPPCSSGMIDVKLTETDLPLFFRAPKIPFTKIAFINAHARVEIRQVDTDSGALPIGLPDVNPVAAAAIFFNENTGAVLATKALTSRGPMPLNGRTLVQWDNVGAPVPVTIGSPNTGVVVALSGQTNWSLGGTLSAICSQVLVDCYSGGSGGPWSGLEFLHGYPTTGIGTPAAPILRDVYLYNASCTDASGPYFLLNGNCTAGIKAKIDFGPVPVPAGAVVKLPGYGCPNGGTNPKGCPLTYRTTGADAGYWTTGTQLPTFNANAGALAVNLGWKTSLGSGTFTQVQRAFSASPASGPVQFAQVTESASLGANSLAYGTHNLVVGIGVAGSLGNASSVNDPAVALRVVGGSQNQSLDCDPDYSKLKDELAYGCRPVYTRNTGVACPANAGVLWASVQPWPCVAIQTGTATNQVPEGLNTRILGAPKPSSCPPNVGDLGHNNWSMFNSPGLPIGDPRIVQVFLTPFGSFSGNGSGTVPVTNFATFYVTGWTGSGSGFANPCQGNGDDPVPNNDAGYIVGHFIKYVQSLNRGGGSQKCDLTAFGSCIAVLTE